MPLLRPKVSGGHIIVGPPFGGSNTICTWQVTPDALHRLKSKGVRDWGRVPAEDLQSLIESNLLWTGGTGPGHAATLTQEDSVLVDVLVDWSSEGGGVSGFERLLCPGGGLVDRPLFDRIFSKTFVNWLRSLPGVSSLSEYDAISRTDFDSLAGDRLGRLESPLHRVTGLYCDNRVAWRLAEIIGRVAWQVESGGPCPASWASDFPVLALLYERLEASPKPTGPDDAGVPGRRRTALAASLPYVWWDVDGQQVIAVLPGRTLPAGSSLAWSVAGAEVAAPDSFPIASGLQFGEARSEPLDPAGRYAIRVVGGPGEVVERIIHLPDGDRPLVLFAADGRLLDGTPGLHHRPGTYLALSRHPIVEGNSTRRGVQSLEELDYEPVGWNGWTGYRLELEPGAEVRPYEIGGPQRPADWRLGAGADDPVKFEGPLRVSIASWPRIEIEGPAYFAEATLEVAREGRDASSPGRLLKFGEQITIREDGDGRSGFELSDLPSLDDLYGKLRLTCRLPRLPEMPPLELAMVRIRSAEFSYVEHPTRPGSASAVAIRTDQAIMAGDDCERIQAGESVVFSRKDPRRSPNVTVLLPDSQAVLRIRIPVTRLRRLSTGSPAGPWEDPPLRLRLAEVRFGDILRVEFHLEPELHDGRPLCRLVGGPYVAAGKPHPLPNTFDIELSRWRDDLGPDARGIVQFRGRDRWVDLVRLDGQSVVTLADPIGSGHDCRRELELAAVGDDRDGVTRIAGVGIDDAGPGMTTGEIVRIAAGRAYMHMGLHEEAERALDGLGDRGDLHEVALIRELLKLRRGQIARAQRASWREALARESVSCPLAHLVVAEAYARHASGPGGGLAMWESCLRLLRPIAGIEPVGRPRSWWSSIDLKEALLLRSLSVFRLGRRPEVPVGAPESGLWGWLPRLAFAAHYVTTPWRADSHGRAVPSADLPTPPSYRGRDADLIRLVLRQAAGGREDSSAYLSRFDDMMPEEFGAIDLLRMRQCRLEGRAADWRSIYTRLYAWALENGQITLLEILMDETPPI